VTDPPISAVVTTYNRAARCVSAVRSVLAQGAALLEVLVVDHGSTDETPDAVRALAAEDPRVRYVGLAGNSGSGARPRNAGFGEARGDWVALLDDDDEWLPGKLSAQVPYLEGDRVLVCANALRSDGAAYFPAGTGVVDFGLRELLRDNEIITSTAIVRRAAMLAAGGFPEAPAYAGAEDYAGWLALADGGGRFARIPEVVARYETGPGDRLSTDALRNQRLVTGLVLSRWRRHPADPRLGLVAGRHLLRVAKLWSRSSLRRRSAPSSTAS
jgi:glycosyltransferase involved in cell wall biosynthesis